MKSILGREIVGVASNYAVLLDDGTELRAETLKNGYPVFKRFDSKTGKEIKDEPLKYVARKN